MLKFIRYLPEWNWSPVVLTVREIWSRAYDESLLKEIPPGVEVIRTHSLDTRRILYLIQKVMRVRKAFSEALEANSRSVNSRSIWVQRILSFLTLVRAWLFFPDEMMGWIPFAFFKGFSLIRKEKISVVITSSFPHSTHLVGWLLKKSLGGTQGLKWIAEFRDAWAYHPHFYFPSFIHRALARFLEKQIFKTADRVVLAYGLSDNQRRYPEFQEKMVGITNGYDESDFQGLVPRREQGFNLVHIGVLYQGQTPVYFFQALSELFAEKPELKEIFKVHFIGGISEEHLPSLKPFFLDSPLKNSLNSVVKLIPYLPHLLSLEYLMGADVLLLFLGGEDGHNVIPGKVFEYLRAPAPILAMVPEGETAELVRQGKSGLVVGLKDVEGIKRALLSLWQNFQEQKLIEKDWEFIKTKERKELTRSLVNTLEELYSER